MKLKNMLAVGAVITVAACVNKSILSNSRITQPVPKAEVQVYFASDSIPQHERIAILNGKGDESLTNESQMIDKLREEAGSWAPMQLF